MFGVQSFYVMYGALPPVWVGDGVLGSIPITTHTVVMHVYRGLEALQDDWQTTTGSRPGYMSASVTSRAEQFQEYLAIPDPDQLSFDLVDEEEEEEKG